MNVATLFNTGIRPAIDAYLLAESLKKRSYGDYWSASSAGYCMRKLVMERLGVPPVTPLDERKTRVFEAGDIFHSWIQGITRESGLSVAQELELQDESFMIRGHIDDLVLIGGGKPELVVSDEDTSSERRQWVESKKLILYDYKTVHSKSFHWSKKNGGAVSHYHRLQVGTYMYMLRKSDPIVENVGSDNDPIPVAKLMLGTELTEARILKISKDDLCMEELQVLWTPELEDEVLAYWTTLNKYWVERKLPPCTCADHEGGFMAREQFNPFFYEGQPCSVAWLTKMKNEGKLRVLNKDV